MSFCQDIYNMLCRKYPNSNIYLLSDHHFGHKNILGYTRMQFESIELMHDRIIREHNESVGKDDIIIFLGDLGFKNSILKDILPKLNGHKFLILGNHDQPTIVKTYPSFGLEGVYINPIRLNGDYLSHEPLVKGEREDEQFNYIAAEFAKCSGAMNYHGHIHTEERLDGNHYTNVTCEALDFKPLLVGRTHELESQGKELFINSPYFGEKIDELCSRNCINNRMLLKDYIYSYILSAITSHSSEFFIQGSFGLYKKYGFISDFSDIDISQFYDLTKSKTVNSNQFKAVVDDAFEALKDIDNINLSFIKRYPTLRMLEALYTTKNPYSVRCYVDANLVWLDSYRDSDFYTINGNSLMEKLLLKDDKSLLEDYAFPEFSTNVIIPEADIANLILQLLFQKDLGHRKGMILRKLQYIYKAQFCKSEMRNFEDIFTRFFLRNICLLHALHRYDEISYVQGLLNEFPYLLELLPDNIQEVISGILKNGDSMFMDVYADISSIKPEEVVEKSSELMKKIR